MSNSNLERLGDYFSTKYSTDYVKLKIKPDAENKIRVFRQKSSMPTELTEETDERVTYFLNCAGVTLVDVDMFYAVKLPAREDFGVATEGLGPCTGLALKLEHPEEGDAIALAHLIPFEPARATRAVIETFLKDGFNVSGMAFSLNTRWTKDFVSVLGEMGKEGLLQVPEYHFCYRPQEEIVIGSMAATKNGGVFFVREFDFEADRVINSPVGTWQW